MKNFFQKTRTWITTHKKTSILIVIVLIIIGYFIYKKTTSTTGETRYTLGTVTKGTVVASITGSGQVSTERSLDLKPQASANVVYVGATAGQTVNQGDLIVELDATDAEKAVRDAEANLESSQLALQKSQEPPQQLTVLQAQDALTQAQADLTSEYQSGFDSVSNAFLDLPTIITGLDSTLHGTDANATTNGQENINYYATTASQYETAADSGKGGQYAADAEAKYQAAYNAYEQNFSDYKSTSAASSTADIQSIINETYTTSQLMSDAVKSATNLIQYYQDVLTAQNRTPVPKSTTELTTLAGYTSQIDGHVSDLLNIKNTIVDDTTAIPEKQASLAQIQAGTDPIDLQSAQLDVTKSQNALQDAKDTLADYYVYAPFSGTLSAVDVKVGDPASSGTAVATLIANQEVVVIPLNEVDVSKVALGDKATLTFDAVTGLTLTGEVSAIDTVGTVSQGVVNYNVTINFDSIDPRVKPGMSTTASIITQIAQNALIVPASAVKTSAQGSYVQAFTADTPATGSNAAVPAAGASGTDTTAAADETTPAPATTTIVSTTPPENIPVTIGISDDINTEILSGLTEGEQIVTKTTVVTAQTPTTSAPSLLGGATGRGGVGGTAAARGGAAAAAFGR